MKFACPMITDVKFGICRGRRYRRRVHKRELDLFSHHRFAWLHSAFGCLSCTNCNAAAKGVTASKRARYAGALAAWRDIQSRHEQNRAVATIAVVVATSRCEDTSRK